MKTFKMLLLAIAALCVTACENDEAAYIGVPESIELSADAPLREPYAAWMQGGVNFDSGRLGAILAAQSMLRAGFLENA